MEIKTKKKMSKKKVIFTSVGVVLCIAVGTLTGVLLANQLSPKGVDSSTLDENSYSDNPQKLYENYLADPKDPLEYKPYDLANISIYKYSLNKYTTSEVTSTANAVALGFATKQTTYGKSIKNDDKYFNESLSNGFIGVAKRFYQTGEEVDIYSGTLKNDDKGIYGTYTDDKEILELKEYENIWGKNLTNPVIYIISSKTALDTSVVSETEQGYKISLDLDPVSSVIKYAKQMVRISNLTDTPRFDKVHVEFDVDKELNLLEMNVSEHYKAEMGISADTTATLTEKYTILDSPMEIPTIDEEIYF